MLSRKYVSAIEARIALTKAGYVSTCSKVGLPQGWKHIKDKSKPMLVIYQNPDNSPLWEIGLYSDLVK